jgi:hypothetical protein
MNLIKIQIKISILQIYGLLGGLIIANGKIWKILKVFKIKVLMFLKYLKLKKTYKKLVNKII